jgi:hypothetical protein
MDGGKARVRRARTSVRALASSSGSGTRRCVLSAIATAVLAVGMALVPAPGTQTASAGVTDETVVPTPTTTLPSGDDVDAPPDAPTTTAPGDTSPSVDPATGETPTTVGPVADEDDGIGPNEPAEPTDPTSTTPAPAPDADSSTTAVPTSAGMVPPSPDLGRPAWAVTNPGAAKAISYEPGAGGGLVSDPFGNTFVAGDVIGPIGIQSAVGPPTQLDAGKHNSIYVARYRSDGSVSAATIVARNASSDTLGTDPLGNIYVVGHGTGVSVPTPAGSRSLGSGAFVIKLRNDLSEVWAVVITPNQTPITMFPWDAPAAADGNSTGEVAAVAFGTLVRIDGDGTIVRTTASPDATDVALGEDGTMYESVRSGEGVRALGRDGTVQWTLGDAADHLRASSVAVGPDGDLTVAGIVETTTTIGPPETPLVLDAQQRASFVVRVKADGAPVWGQLMTAPGSYYSPSWFPNDPFVAVGTDGRVALAYFDGSVTSHVLQFAADGAIQSDTEAQTIYWYLPSLRVAIDAVGAVSLQGTHARTIVFGTAPDTLTLPQPSIAAIFLAHWGPTTLPSPGSMKVTTSYLGDPQVGMWIGVTPAGAHEGTVHWVAVDDQGVARFDDLEAGPYRVTELDWEGRFARTWFANAPTFTEAADVPVRPSHTAAITYDLALRPQSGIVGTVRDADGSPLPAITVQLFSTDGFVRSTSTGSTGGYVLTGLPSGDYWIRFVDTSGRHLGRWYDGAESPATRTTIAVGDDLVTVDGQLPARRVDVALDVSYTTSHVRVGSTFQLSIGVQNLGPDGVAFIDIAPVLPSTMHLAGIEGEAGQAIANGWRTGPVAPGASTFVVASVAVDDGHGDGHTSVGATASVAAIDVDPANDHADRSIEVVHGTRPDGLWASSIHGPGEAITYGIAVDHDGNTYASGWFRGVVTFGEGSAAVTWSDDRTVPDMWFAKFDRAGALVWVRRGSGVEQMDPTGGGVAVAPDGSLYVTGFFEGTVTFGEGGEQRQLSSWGGTQMFLLRFDRNGRLLFAVQYGQRSYGWTVAVGPDGLAYVAGRESMSTYDWVTHRYRFSVGFVAAFDPWGSLSHVTLLDAEVDQPQAMARSATVDEHGVLYVVGTVGESMTFGAGTSYQAVLHARGGYDGFLAIYEPDGRLRSASLVGGPGPNEKLSGVRPAGDGDTFVSGYLEAGATVGPDSTAVSQAGGYLIRVAPDGSSRWIRSLGASVRQVVTDQFGALYVMGGTSENTPFDVHDGSAEEARTSHGAESSVWGAEDAYVAKFYPDGDFDWILHAGGPRRDVAFTAAVDDTGLIHLGGSTSAVAVFCIGPDESVAHSTGKTNAFIATCAPPDGAEEPWHDERVSARADAATHTTGPEAIPAVITVTVENRGPYPSAEADLTFDVPAGTDVTSITASAGSVSDGTWHGPVLASGASVTIEAAIVLPPQAAPGTFAIGATLHASDLVPWNNQTQALVAVVSPPPPPPPTTTTTPPTTTPPTTSPTTAPTSPTSVAPTSSPTVKIPLPQLVFGPPTAPARPAPTAPQDNGGRRATGGSASTATPSSATSTTRPGGAPTDGPASDDGSGPGPGAQHPKASIGSTLAEPAPDELVSEDASGAPRDRLRGSEEPSLAGVLIGLFLAGWFVAAVAALIMGHRRRTGSAGH